MHEAAKKAFDTLGGTKIPTVAQIQTEFSGLLADTLTSVYYSSYEDKHISSKCTCI